MTIAMYSSEEKDVAAINSKGNETGKRIPIDNLPSIAKEVHAGKKF